MADDIGRPIDTSRPMIRNPDGSFSTESTITIESDGKWYNVPTIINGERVDEKTAIDHALKNDAHVGVFPTREQAEAAAQARTDAIDKIRKPDMSTDYLELKDKQRRQTAADSMMELIRLRRLPERTKPKGEGTPPPVTPGTSEGNIRGPLKKAAETIGAVGKDIIQGVVETPRQALGGSFDAIENTVHAMGDLFGWLDTNMPLGSVTLSPLRYEQPGFFSGAREVGETALQQFDMPDVGQARSTTGGLARGVSQFLAGFVGAGKLKPISIFKPTTTGGQITKAAGQGVIADLSVFDPHEARLSNLIQEIPALQNPVTEYLAADPNDSAAEGRFKQALEGLMLGTLADGFYLAVRALRANSIAKAEMGTSKVEVPSEESVIGIKEDAFRILGDETQEAPILAPRREAKAVDVERQRLESTLPRGAKLDEAGEFYSLPGSDIPRNATLTPEARVVEDAFARKLETDFESARATYEALPDADGGRILSADEAKNLSEDYLADRSHWANAVHEPASWFIKRLYAEKLAETVPEGMTNTVTFTAGGTGAGKTSALNVLPIVKDVSDHSHITLDGNLSSYNSGVRKIEQALDAGHDVYITYVLRDPVEAFQSGVLKRAMGEKSTGQGRVVPIQTHESTHVRSKETIKRIAKRYENDERVSIEIIDNTNGFGNAMIGSLESFNKINYNNLDTRLRKVLDEEYLNGNITEKIYRKTLEQSEPGRGPKSATGPPGGRAQAVDEGIDREAQTVRGEIDRRGDGLEPQRERQTGNLAPEINFARIDTTDDVKAVMDEMVQQRKAGINKARRGKQTFEEIELNAEQVDAWETLISRRQGQPLNAEQSVAARQLWVSSGEKLTEAARLAAQDPSEANLFAFRKMLAIHDAVQKEVIAARTETARALASWRIPTGGNIERLRGVELAIQMHGGTQVSRELAKRITAIAESGQYRELDKLVEKSARATTMDMVKEAWIMALLSGPKTHLVNTMSNTSVALMQIYERKAANFIGRVLGDQGGVELGESMAMWYGMIEGTKDGFRYAWKSMKSGESGMGLGKIEVGRPGSISAEGMGIASETWLGRGVDGIGNIIRIPGRMLVAEDEFFKTIGYRMELNAQAVRQATQEVHAGKITEAQMKGRIYDLVQNPPEHIRLSAMDQALYQTFTNKTGKLAKWLSRMSNEVPLAKFLLPFVRTPSNILKYGFERSPLAPLMKNFRADVAAGGARRDLAMARMSTGTLIMLAAADMAQQGLISGGGPRDPGERARLRRTGWQPYSIKLGDRWFSYRRGDPIGLTFGLAADMSELLLNADDFESIEEDTMAIGVALAASIGNNITNKTYLTGISDFFEAMSDPLRRSENWAERFAGSFIPTGVAEIARFQDPYMHEVNGMIEAVKARTPMFSKTLPKKPDLWGQPVTYISGLGKTYDAISPIYSKREKTEPIDKELGRLETPLRMPGRTISIDGVTVRLRNRPEIYSRYVVLAGNELKHPVWGKGAKDLLNAIVKGKHELSAIYEIKSDGPDGGKSDMIRQIISEFRSLARKQLLEEFKDLREEVEEGKRIKRQLLMPVPP